MKMLALSFALLAAAGPALAEGAASDLHHDAPRLEANMAEKKQLRAVQGHQEVQFEIQTQTSDFQNAENVRSQAKEAKMIRPLRALESAQAIEGLGSPKKVGSLKVDKLIPGPHTPAIGGAIGGYANDGDEVQ